MSEGFSKTHTDLLQRLELERDALDRAVAVGNREAVARAVDQILNLAGQFDALCASTAPGRPGELVPEHDEAVVLGR